MYLTTLSMELHAWHVVEAVCCSGFVSSPRVSFNTNQVLSACIAYCPCLRTLKLDGNPIGRSGARAVLRGLAKRGTAYSRSLRPDFDVPSWMIPRHRKVEISLLDCNIQVSLSWLEFEVKC